ncbi:PEP/pyruvate-binding domain-containing protein [Streptomyces inhibens]|uniref:PEP/pyruvate-binding domain-containing protein n=1 Tax=Streptomyces inhibens TaxID=2293571 RepID=UPI001EE6DE2A|nr:PEP/pyruvate-binding domain-containing protein [Streptomyces inhibens]UKY49285.1 hypothetical protein KI385_11055 [Streptomyces inhibens]
MPAPTLDDVECEGVTEELGLALAELGAGHVVVRSSALGEDGAARSFAGVFASVMPVKADVECVRAALRQVRASAASPSAAAYRSALGYREDTRMAALVQEMIVPVSSGVMFTAHPVTGKRQFLVESSWGFCHTVVAGGSTPDRFTVDVSGRVLEQVVAGKERMVGLVGEDIAALPVGPASRDTVSLSAGDLQDLVRLGGECEALLGGPQDIEWASADGRMWIVQSRPITV